MANKVELTSLEHGSSSFSKLSPSMLIHMCALRLKLASHLTTRYLYGVSVTHYFISFTVAGKALFTSSQKTASGVCLSYTCSLDKLHVNQIGMDNSIPKAPDPFISSRKTLEGEPREPTETLCESQLCGSDGTYKQDEQVQLEPCEATVLVSRSSHESHVLPLMHSQSPDGGDSGGIVAKEESNHEPKTTFLPKSLLEKVKSFACENSSDITRETRQRNSNQPGSGKRTAKHGFDDQVFDVSQFSCKFYPCIIELLFVFVEAVFVAPSSEELGIDR